MENNTGRERRIKGTNGILGGVIVYIAPLLIITVVMYAVGVFVEYDKMKSIDKMSGGTGELVELSENEDKELVVKEVILWERKAQVIGEEGEEILLSKYSFEEFKPEVGVTVGYKKKEHQVSLLNKEYMSENVSEIMYIKLP